MRCLMLLSTENLPLNSRRRFRKLIIGTTVGRENYKNSYHPAEELKPNFDPKGKICAEFEYFQQFCNWLDRYSRIANRKLFLLTKITGSLLPEDLAYGKSLNMEKKIKDTDIANYWLQFNLDDTMKSVSF